MPRIEPPAWIAPSPSLHNGMRGSPRIICRRPCPMRSMRSMRWPRLDQRTHRSHFILRTCAQGPHSHSRQSRCFRRPRQTRDRPRCRPTSGRTGTARLETLSLQALSSARPRTSIKCRAYRPMNRHHATPRQARRDPATAGSSSQAVPHRQIEQKIAHARRLHRTAAHRRQDTLHTFSRTLLHRYQTIVVGMLKTQLQYKVQQAGSRVRIVSENTTRAPVAAVRPPRSAWPQRHDREFDPARERPHAIRAGSASQAPMRAAPIPIQPSIKGTVRQ